MFSIQELSNIRRLLAFTNSHFGTITIFLSMPGFNNWIGFPGCFNERRKPDLSNSSSNSFHVTSNAVRNLLTVLIKPCFREEGFSYQHVSTGRLQRCASRLQSESKPEVGSPSGHRLQRSTCSFQRMGRPHSVPDPFRFRYRIIAGQTIEVFATRRIVESMAFWLPLNAKMIPGVWK